MRQSVVAVCAVLLTASQAAGWNYAGHKAIAFLAYSHLTPKTKQRVNEILQRHPDYVSILSKGDSQRPSDLARNAFVTASTWSDMIRNDGRFSDSGDMPPAAGFEDSSRHTDWHYINIPWPDEFGDQPVPPVNAVSQLKSLVRQMKSSGPADSSMAYALPWLLHIVMDLHQPLHAVTRFNSRGGKPEHDKGGNACYVEPGRNLHAFWDGILGRNDSENAVARLAASLSDETPRPSKLDVNPQSWVREAIAVIPTHVYNVGECGDRERPAKISSEYRHKAEQLARQRAALSAYRLAKMLNDRLGK